MQGNSKAIAVLGLVLGLLGSGCQQSACECVGAIPGGSLDVACGARQCAGGVLYECTGPGTATAVAPSCAPAPMPDPDPMPTPTNPRPAGLPDVVIIGVSGHCFGFGCPSFNTENLASAGTLDVLAEPFYARGIDVEILAATDNFYDQPIGSASPTAYGFLSLDLTLRYIRDTYIADYDDPTRVIVVGHSHGAVWAHIALNVLEQEGAPLPVDVLIDIDGVSPGFEGKAIPLTGVGDAWGPVIRAHAESTGRRWPFPIWNVEDAINIPGVAEPQDIEDVVPRTVLVNLEIWADDAVFFMDSQPNHRTDGSTTNIFWTRSAEGHESADAPTAVGVLWARDSLREIYRL
jgi:hypothetical protein